MNNDIILKIHSLPQSVFSLGELSLLFPDIEYALAQIDEMRRLVLFNFSKAAQIGLQLNSEDSIKKREKDEALGIIAKHELNQIRK